MTMPPKERLWLDNEQRLLPYARSSSEKDQNHPIRLRACWSFDLPTEDNELVPEESVLSYEFGLVFDKVSHPSQQERGVGWLCPVDKAAMERLKVFASQAFDGDDNTMHSIQFLFEDEQVHAFRFYIPSGESARSDSRCKLLSKNSFVSGYHM